MPEMGESIKDQHKIDLFSNNLKTTHIMFFQDKDIINQN